MSGVRVAVLRAGDAPAPSIVIDLAHLLPGDASRAAIRGVIVPVRAEVLARYPHIDQLGVKTIGVFASNAGEVWAEFFQGEPHGALPAESPKVCLNSLACALTVATTWYPALARQTCVVVRMGDRTYHLSRLAPTCPWAPALAVAA